MRTLYFIALLVTAAATVWAIFDVPTRASMVLPIQIPVALWIVARRLGVVGPQR